MKLSQAIHFITLLATSDAMSIRGIVNESAVVGEDDLAKVTALPIKDTAVINKEQQGDHRQLSHIDGEPIALGACEDFAVMAGSTATCAGSFDCDIIGGHLAVSPGTSITGNFVGDVGSGAGCAIDGLAAWKAGRAMPTGTLMLAEMGGKTFTKGIYTHGSALNIALTDNVVYLDAQGDPNAQFIFNIGSTLTTSAGSKIVLQNEAKADNVFWILGKALTMGADSILVGNVLAGTAITMGTNAKIMGRAIAQTAVTCETACAVETSGRHSVDVPTFNDCPSSSVFTPIADSHDQEITGDNAVASYTLPFSFPWITGEEITEIGVSTNGAINVPYNSSSLCCDPWPIAVGGSGDAAIPRIAVAQEDLDPSYNPSYDPRYDPLYGGGVYIKTADDGNSVTSSWENVPHYGTPGTFVNAQVTLHKTGDITFCYGTGNTGSNSIAAGLEDDASSLAFPMPLDGFDAQGVSTSFPQNTCACFGRF
mmetsp:Transcript_640/g.1267  ORF Transcript_640/g.1267 Transcript_640/m.1267 type:complete len:480 (+) Transcript_640:242-1681(+)